MKFKTHFQNLNIMKIKESFVIQMFSRYTQRWEYFPTSWIC